MSIHVNVPPVVQEPFGFRLPPRDITGPKSYVRAVAPLYLLPYAIGIIGLLALDRHPSGVIGALIASAVVFLMVGIEFPLIRRSQRRRQQAPMANLPDGGIYAGRVSLFPSEGTRGTPKIGNVLLDTMGVAFTPANADAPSLTVEWRNVSRIRLGQAPGKIGVGRLVLTLTDGTTRTFSVPLYGLMAEVLRKHL